MAAGSSRRFGSDKRLYTDSNGALLEQTLSHVLALGLPTVVMLRSQDQPNCETLLGGHAAHTKLTARFVNEPERGLGHSMSQCFTNAPQWEGALLFLGDMPRVKTTTGQTLLDHFSESRIQVPTYQEKRGHPVLFPRCFFGELAKLEGDSGAKALIAREQSKVDEHTVNDPGILWDLDEKPSA